MVEDFFTKCDIIQIYTKTKPQSTRIVIAISTDLSYRHESYTSSASILKDKFGFLQVPTEIYFMIPLLINDHKDKLKTDLSYRIDH